MGNRISVADRMERLPITGYHRLVAAIIFICWASTSMNMTGTNFTLPLVIQHFGFTNIEGGYFSSAAFAGMLVGSLVSGVLADRFGRKKIACALIAVWMIGSIATGFMNSLGGLLACRVIAGIGMGAMTPILVAYISEIIPTKKRAQYITTYMMIGGVGVVIACFITMFFANGLGWRAVYWLEGAFGISFILIALFVPESCMWLEAKGRLDEADAVV
ncbi:MAG: MFS transporter, partial [Eggerthellaceae bacterium]|nr:MFS transporter [Eggerthellaceae bacterium]